MKYKDLVGGEENLRQYVNKVYKMLSGLKPGSRILVRNIVKAETKQLFIDTVELYQQEIRDLTVQFNIDYEYLRKK